MSVLRILHGGNKTLTRLIKPKFQSPTDAAPQLLEKKKLEISSLTEIKLRK